MKTGFSLALLCRIAFWAAFVFALVMAFLPHPPHTMLDSFSDKVQHSLAFCVLAWLATAAYPRMPLLRLTERLSFLGAMIEVVQSIPVLHRDCDILDWVTDTVAISLALLITHAIRRRRASRIGQK